jgi:hypothetical protein
MPMRFFFSVALVYALVGLGVVLPRYDRLADFLPNALSAITDYADLVKGTAIWFLPIAVVLPLVLRPNALKARAVSVFLAVMGCVAMQVGFTFLKSSIPSFVPFYADPYLAAFGRFLHGGVDPWVLAHRAVSPQVALDLLPVYLQIWTICAISLPVFIALSDDNAERIRRFVWMYLFCWIIIGNVLAILFSSVGPVYYDRLLGGDRFAQLQGVLAQSGIKSSTIGVLQDFLWQAYKSHELIIGTGISAFPSVHLGIASTTALYISERSLLFLPVGVIFVGIILFLSVYTGYHYATDGYFSILVVVGFWAWLRRKGRQEVTDEAIEGDKLPHPEG